MSAHCAAEHTASGELVHSTARDSWLAARRTGIGASDAWRLFAEPYALWADKSGLVEDADLSDVERIQWGNLLEPVVLAELGRRASVVVEGSGYLFRSRAHPWAMTTLDGVARVGDGLPVECKTASAWLAEEWADGAPPRYRWQVQHQMLVTGAPRALLGCLLGGQRLVWSWVERDESMIATLTVTGAEMWRRIVEGDAPPADGSAASSRALAARHPTDDGATVVLPGTLVDVGAELDALAIQRAAIVAREDELKAAVKQAIGGATRGVLVDGSGWTWKAQSKAEHVVKASTSRVLRRTRSKEE